MNLMLLAAGEGTRLRPYTLVKPKPAIPFLGVPLAAHSLSFTDSLKIQNLVVNTFHLPEEIHRLFDKIPVHAKQTFFSDESGQIQDTGGGLGKARRYFQDQGDFFLMNADEVILPLQERAVEKAVDFHRQTNSLATLFVMDHPGVGTEFGGVWADENNQVIGFGKQPYAKAKKAWHFIGAQILSDRIFNYIPEGPSNILYGPVTTAIAKGEKVQIIPLDCAWFETGNLNSFLTANKKCLDFMAGPDGSEKRTLEKTLKNYSNTEFILDKGTEGLLWRSVQSDIPAATKVRGFAIVGDGARIGQNCFLENVVVNEKAIIADGSILKDQIVL